LETFVRLRKKRKTTRSTREGAQGTLQSAATERLRQSQGRKTRRARARKQAGRALVNEGGLFHESRNGKKHRGRPYSRGKVNARMVLWEKEKSRRGGEQSKNAGVEGLCKKTGYRHTIRGHFQRGTGKVPAGEDFRKRK